MNLDKPKRTTSEAFKEWLRPGGCACKGPRCYGGLEFHHEKRKGGRGSDPLLGGSDFCGVWLCWSHHMLAQGRLAEFELDLGMPVWEWLFRQLYLYTMERGLLVIDAEPDPVKARLRWAVREALELLRGGQPFEAVNLLSEVALLAAIADAGRA
jgi:hypothetical protein